MSEVGPAFPVKRPMSAWNRPLKADFKGLFGALGRGALHGFTWQWTELGSDAVDAAAALGIDSRDAPQLAWLLVRRSLLSAMAELAREAAPLAVGLEQDAIEGLSDRLDVEIEKEEVTIDRCFFEKPRELPLLVGLETPFSEWLQAYGLGAPAAASVARRLPSYFVAALHAEWRRSPGTYEPIRTRSIPRSPAQPSASGPGGALCRLARQAGRRTDVRRGVRAAASLRAAPGVPCRRSS